MPFTAPLGCGPAPGGYLDRGRTYHFVALALLLREPAFGARAVMPSLSSVQQSAGREALVAEA